MGALLDIAEWAIVFAVVGFFGWALWSGVADLRKPYEPPSPHCLLLLQRLRALDAAGLQITEADIPDNRIGREAWESGYLRGIGSPAGDDVALTSRAFRALRGG